MGPKASPHAHATPLPRFPTRITAASPAPARARTSWVKAQVQPTRGAGLGIAVPASLSSDKLTATACCRVSVSCISESLGTRPFLEWGRRWEVRNPGDRQARSHQVQLCVVTLWPAGTVGTTFWNPGLVLPITGLVTPASHFTSWVPHLQKPLPHLLPYCHPKEGVVPLAAGAANTAVQRFRNPCEC